MCRGSAAPSSPGSGTGAWTRYFGIGCLLWPRMPDPVWSGSWQGYHNAQICAPNRPDGESGRWGAQPFPTLPCWLSQGLISTRSSVPPQLTAAAGPDNKAQCKSRPNRPVPLVGSRVCLLAGSHCLATVWSSAIMGIHRREPWSAAGGRPNRSACSRSECASGLSAKAAPSARMADASASSRRRVASAARPRLGERRAGLSGRLRDLNRRLAPAARLALLPKLQHLDLGQHAILNRLLIGRRELDVLDLQLPRDRQRPFNGLFVRFGVSVFSFARSWIVDCAVNWPVTIFECLRTFGVIM